VRTLADQRSSSSRRERRPAGVSGWTYFVVVGGFGVLEGRGWKEFGERKKKKK